MNKPGKYSIITLVLLTLCVFVRLFSSSQLRVEHYYSTGIFLKISAVLRAITGFIPVSLGDILYLLAGMYGLMLLVRSIIRWVKNKFRLPEKRLVMSKIIKLSWLLMGVYVVFNMLWGINYNRIRLDQALKISVTDTSVVDLRNLNEWLLVRVNDEKKMSLQEKFVPHDINFLKIESALAFDSLHSSYDIPGVQPVSFKPTLFTWVANNSGYTGYYNPFTGEAQINMSNPFYELPFVACHEMAHQIGYAKEIEANFIGFLACMHSSNHLVKYSAYKAMLSYTMSDLVFADTAFARSIYNRISPEVRQDIRLSRRYRMKHSRFLQPFVMGIYEKYLWSNGQPDGLLSYNKVTGLLMGYYRKNNPAVENSPN